jgi:hypothetical protein
MFLLFLIDQATKIQPLCNCTGSSKIYSSMSQSVMFSMQPDFLLKILVNEKVIEIF